MRKCQPNNGSRDYTDMIIILLSLNPRKWIKISKKKLPYKSKQERLRVNCRTRKGFRSFFCDKENNLVNAALPCLHVCFGKRELQTAICSKRKNFNIGELLNHQHLHNHIPACRLAESSSQLACSRNWSVNVKCTLQILLFTNI